MSTLPRRLLRDAVTVETYLSDGAFGPKHADPVTTSGKVTMGRQLVRDAQGVEVVSEMTIYVLPKDAVLFSPESLVTVAGYGSRVISVAEQSRPGESVLAKVTCR